MGKTRPPYPPEFRAEAVRLARSSGRPLSEIAGDLGCSTESLRHWVRQTKVDVGEVEGLTSDEREELRRLRRENRILREEREILKKGLSLVGRPIGPDELRLDRRRESTPLSLPDGARARCGPRGLLRLGRPGPLAAPPGR